jgi:hypothetical protein
VPLTGTSVNLAGQPSKVGGTVARVVGWLILSGGWLLALLIMGIWQLVAPGGWAGYAFGAPVALIASIMAWALLRSGTQLKASGSAAEIATKNQAIFALAQTKNGVLTPWDVAQYLHVTPQEGDAILTKLAKESSEHVTIDVDDDGKIQYRFPAIHWAKQDGHVRVDAAPNVRVEPRDPLEHEDELPVDARRARG